MTPISMQLPIAVVLGATLMDWRANEVAPASSAVQVEMAGWVICGAALLVAGLLWELSRRWQRADQKYLQDKAR